jgi:hypothetical protein
MPDNEHPLDNQDQTNVAVSATGPLSDQDALRLAREAFTTSTTYFDTAIRGGLINDLRQFQGQHPQGSKYLSENYRARSRFFRPKTRSAVRKNEAIAAEAFFSTQDVVSIKAIDEDDDMQRASAEVLKELVQYRLKHSIPWFLIACGAYQDAQVQGIVCSYQFWEFNAKKRIDRPQVKIKPLENIRFDPSCDWYDPVGTSPYFIEMIPMYVKDVRARMQTLDHTGASKWKLIPDTEIIKATTMYSDVVRLQREQGRVDPRSISGAIGDYAIVWVHRNIMEIDGEDYVFHTLGTVSMLDTPKPLRQVYFHGIRPYVIGFSVIETHRAYPSGPVRLTSQIQGELNTNANQRMDNVAFAMNKRYFVKRTAQVDLRSLQRNAPSSSTMMNDPEGDVKIVETQDVTGSAYQEQDRLNLDFDDLMGAFSQASVASNRKLNETVGGMNILTKDASQVTGYQLRTFAETWMEPVLKQLILLEQKYEEDDVVLALAGKKAQLFQKFGIDEITDELLTQNLTVDVNVGIGATNPHDQLQNFIQGMTAFKDMIADGVLVQYGVDVAEIQREILGKLGYKDGKRFFPDDGGDPRVSALLQQIQALQQALSAKEPPEVIAAKVDKLKAETERIKGQRVKEGVEAQFSAVQTAEVIAAVPQVSPVADAVLQGAGYQIPNPAGADPNLPQGAGGEGLSVQGVINKRTGVGFTPPAGPGAVVPAQQNTSPGSPPIPAQPASPAVGLGKGGETMRPDSQGV